LTFDDLKGQRQPVRSATGQIWGNEIVGKNDILCNW